MGRWATRWLSYALMLAGSACGNGCAGRAPGSGVGGAAGTLGSAAGSGGVASGGAGAAGAAATSTAGAGGTAGDATTAGSAGSAGDGGSSAMSGAAGQSADAGAGTGGASVELCPETPAPRLASGTVVELPIELRLDAAPLVFAEENPLPGGGTLTPLGVRFYISEVALLRAGAAPLPVDVVTSVGSVAPYGIYFFNAEDDASKTLRVLAPAGEYGGITFSWGLAQACNTRLPEASQPPLSPTSQMTWPHTGFLFFRYEGRTAFPGQGAAGASGTGAGGASAGSAGAGSMGSGGSAGDPAAAYPGVIHMGGNLSEPLAPLIRVEGAFSVPASGPIQKGLRVALDEIFEGALSDVDLSQFAGPPGEEVVRGERLRQTAPALEIFSFAP